MSSFVRQPDEELVPMVQGSLVPWMRPMRDIVSGLVVFLLIAIAGYRVLGAWMLVMILIPIGDAVVVGERLATT
jgi:hypothetical protein